MNIVVSWSVRVCEVVEASMVHNRRVLVGIDVLEFQVCEGLVQESTVEVVRCRVRTDPWNRTTESILQVSVSEVLWSCGLSIWNATVGTIVVGATCTGKLYRVKVVVHPNRCVVVNAVAVVDVRNLLVCVRHDRRWK